ncbi:APC family permease [Streptomyces sp. SID3343]|uniref:APC family permease n=1 Tax=Streptomyces sp. SID3343 TaxID=2690260 RepID=UPI00136D34BE|nr:APC family permease [Streptomyces sp. SID3343]MYV98026.1 amino acid permease [Streptomyces sp. SID3343]
MSTTEASPASSDKGLRQGSVGLLGTVALGLASVAPAYSIAVTLGFVTLVAGDLAPAALLVGFVPILLTAFAFRELNRSMPDCGTTFVWGTRAFSPYLGWLSGGWVVQICTVIAMTALAQVASAYLLDVVGLDSLTDQTWAVALTGVLILALVTFVAYRGISIAASAQYLLLGLQLVALLTFGIAAFAQHGEAAGAMTPSLSWLNPFGFDSWGVFAQGVLLCLYIYWGWDALITVNEETKDSANTPGKAAVISTVVLLATYLFTAYAAISYAGVGTDALGLGNEDNAADVVATLAPGLVGSATAALLKLSVAISAIAALLTCGVSTSRATLSMATHGAAPERFGRIHPRFATPGFGTAFFGVAAALGLVALSALSGDFLGDAIGCIGLLIAFYYAITGFACVWYFRRDLRNGPRDLWLKGLLPAIGASMMLAAFGRSAYDMWQPDYGNTSLFGVGGVFLLGIGSILLGVVVMLAYRPRARRFFAHGREDVVRVTVTDDALAG